MNTAYLDGEKLPDREALHAALAEQLAFPQWYGANLDALYDLLSSDARPCRIVLRKAERLAQALGEYYGRLVQTLEDAAEANPAFTWSMEEEPIMDLNEAREKLDLLQKKLSAYDHACSLISYDGNTAAPRGTASNRGQTLAILSQERYELSTGAETVTLLEELESRSGELAPIERRMVKLLLKDIRMLQKIPPEEYVALQRLLVEAEDVWHTAKEKSDFPLFEPYLEQIFAAYKRFARYCAPEMDPYDYWLDQFEEGLTKERCESFFATLREHIVPLLKRVQAAPQLDNSMLHGHFSTSAQVQLSRHLMALLGLDPEHVALAATEHPFTTSLGSHLDERITTHYYEDDFSSSMFSVIHEGGHALYDTGSDDTLLYTVLDGGVSMGIHESQSRFYENLLGRSRAFCECIFPLLAELFPDQMQGRDAEALYRAVNRAEPSLIRTEADELTYCLHVMVRYELEKRVFAGELRVHDLPGEWNRLYKEYLGIDVPDDRRGVLQDSHWAGGAIGYFPSYALGSAYGAQFLKKMRRAVDVDENLRKGDLSLINVWNREHIWQFGRLFSPTELLERVLGEPFDPTVYTDYLEEKFTALYDL